MATDDSTDLAAAPALAKIRRLAGERFFARGEAYFAEGAVRTLRRQGHGAEARVVGTRTYRVRLWWADGELEYDCSCPVGRDGAFCKHCVAVTPGARTARLPRVSMTKTCAPISWAWTGKPWPRCCSTMPRKTSACIAS